MNDAKTLTSFSIRLNYRKHCLKAEGRGVSLVFCFRQMRKGEAPLEVFGKRDKWQYNFRKEG